MFKEKFVYAISFMVLVMFTLLISSLFFKVTEGNQEVLISESNGTKISITIESTSRDHRFNDLWETEELEGDALINECVEILKRYEEENAHFLKANNML